MAGHKESSSELSSLAGAVLNMPPLGEVFEMTGAVKQVATRYDELLTAAKRLAGSVLSQDETPGQLDALQRSVIQGRPDATMLAGLPEEAVERAHDAASNVPSDVTEAWAFLKDQVPAVLYGGAEAMALVQDLFDNAVSSLTPPMAVHGGEEQPVHEANAPGPEVMRQELINIAIQYIKPPSPFKAGQMVDNMLAKQMAFYSQMAEPELTADPVEQMAVVSEMMGLGNAVISQGATMVNHMLPADQEKWRSTVTRYRDALNRMAELFS